MPVSFNVFRGKSPEINPFHILKPFLVQVLLVIDFSGRNPRVN